MLRQAPYDQIGVTPTPKYTNADPLNGVKGSIPNAETFNQLQYEAESLVAMGGLAADGTNLFQWTQAMSRGGIWAGSLTGTGDLAVATLAIPNSGLILPALLQGMRLAAVASAANTTTSPKLRLMNLGSAGLYQEFPILREDGSALLVGDIVAGRRYRFEADGAGNVLISGGGLGSATTANLNAYFLNRPAQQQLFVHPTSGSEGNDGLTSQTPRKDIDAVLDQQQNVGTAIVLLGDVKINRRRNFFGALSMYGGTPDGNGGWTATNRQVSFKAVADNSPLNDGTSFTAGLWILGSASFTTNYLGFSLPIQPAGLTFADHIRSDNGGAVLIRGASLNVDGAGAGSLLGNNGGIPLRAIVTIGLGSGAAGHLFLGIAAGGNPNTNPLQYQSNVTSG